MSLSKIFIDSLESEDEISIWRAMKEANRVFSELLPPDTSEENGLNYFFQNVKTLQPNDRFNELMQFWNDIEKYIWDWPDQKLEDFWIIQVIQKLESVQQAFQYNMTLEQHNNEFLVKLQNLSETIEDTNQKKYLVRLTEKDNSYQVKNVFSLKWFDEEFYHPYRDYILCKLIQWMDEGGLVILVSGDRKVTRQLKGFKLGNNDWKVCRTDFLESLQEMVFRINQEDKRKGLIPGYTIADFW